MKLNFNFDRKTLKKLLKDSLRETYLDYTYENGLSKETIKKLYDMDNSLLLGIMQTSNKDDQDSLKVLHLTSKNMNARIFVFFIYYLMIITKFIVLSSIFFIILFFFAKSIDRFHDYVKDYIFSIIMILYTALLYKLVGDEFKLLMYMHYCHTYSKRKFKVKRKLVLTNLKLKKRISEGFFDFDSELKEQLMQQIKNTNEIIESWKKL